MYCSEALLVNHGDRKVRAITLYCRSWKCDICLPRRKSQLVREASEGKPNRLITLTTRRVEGGDPDAEAKRQGVAFGRLMQQIKRSFPGSEIEYFAVREATKKGWPHIHVLMRGPFIHWKQLRRWWVKFSGSPGIDVRKIWRPAQAAKYVAKYIGKNPHQFGKAKRYWKSKNWVTLEPAEDHNPDGWATRWSIEVMTKQEFYLMWWQRGYQPDPSSEAGEIVMYRPP